MTIAPGATPGVPATPLGSTDNEYVVVGDVLDFARQHPPAISVPFDRERLTLDHCLAARQRNIQPYRMVGERRWVDYKAVLRAFDEMRSQGSASHIGPYADSEVFAPVKVVVAEAHPLRALLTYEPVYPWRARLGTLIPGQRLWYAYAAVAVLNSDLGHALYWDLARAITGRPPSKDGLQKETLDLMPVARRDSDPDALHTVAKLACQISALYEAERECGASFAAQIRELEQHLAHALPRLLRLTEPVVHRVLARTPRSPGAEHPELSFSPSDLLGPLPRLPPVRLLSNSQRAHLADLTSRSELSDAERAAQSRLIRLQFWEEAVHDGLPRELRREPMDRVA